MPAKAGIQHCEALRKEPRRRGVLDHPRSQMMTSAMMSARRQTQLTHTCRGNACICQLLEFCSLNGSLQPLDASVKFLSISQLFSSVRSRLSSVLALRASSMRFRVPPCFAAFQNSKCIVGLRLGLLGFYRSTALIAAEVFTGEIWIPSVMVMSVAKVVRQLSSWQFVCTINPISCATKY
jgi:hypothetical protein